jgi:pyruvate/2-oxoglutarate dehydrogenase complex dihydrolipoamide dehydrogenase (E3) component
MIRAAGVWEMVRQAGTFGIHAEQIRTDFGEAMAYKDRAMRQVGGDPNSDAGLGKMGGKLFRIHAVMESPHEVRVGKEVIFGERIVLATGTTPTVPPIPGLKEAGYITNREATHLTTLPNSLVVLGAGVIGLEFAQTFRRYGAEVTVVELGTRTLPREDADIAARVQAHLEKEGIRFLLSTSIQAIEKSPNGKQVTLSSGEVLVCEEILVATGRRAAVEGLQLEATGLALERNYLKVDSGLRTSVPHIYAPGDIHGAYLFTHVASYEGKIVANNAFQESQKVVDYRVIPRATFLDPEIASVGATEEELQAAETPYRVLTFDFEDLDRAILHGKAEGLVKLLVDERDGQVLGGHIWGHEASSLLGEVAVVMQNRLPVTAITATMHAYPSFPEAIESAALGY